MPLVALDLVQSINSPREHRSAVNGPPFPHHVSRGQSIDGLALVDVAEGTTHGDVYIVRACLVHKPQYILVPVRQHVSDNPSEGRGESRGKGGS